MKCLRIIVLVVLVGVVSSGCVGRDLISKRVIKQLENTNGAILNVNSGETFSIELPANPTGGHVWDLELSFEIIELQNRNFESGFNLYGDGTETFRFKALGAGDGEIQFRYLKTWELNAEPDKIIDYQVNIK